MDAKDIGSGVAKLVGRRIAMWAVIAGSLMTIIGFVSYVAGSDYRPALSIELKEARLHLAAGIADVNQLATEQALSATQLRIYQNKREQDQIRRENLPPPNWLIQEQVDLENKKRRLELRIEGK